MASAQDRFDVVIAGAGPTGLSAALVPRRCRRSVLRCDAGTPRDDATHATHATHAMHGYLSHDGIAPDAFRAIAHAEPAACDTVRFRPDAVEDARVGSDGFVVSLRSGDTATCRKLLLATGMWDELPPIPGAAELFGRSVHTCPYCDAW